MIVANIHPNKLAIISFLSKVLSKYFSFRNPNIITIIGAMIIPSNPNNPPIYVNHPAKNRCKNLSTPILFANLLKNSIIE
jgi:hypothetical protein